MVVLTNSPWQIGQISKASRGVLPRLADAPEYRFFRARYPRGEVRRDGIRGPDRCDDPPLVRAEVAHWIVTKGSRGQPAGEPSRRTTSKS